MSSKGFKIKSPLGLRIKRPNKTKKNTNDLN
ncbi:hypothetical protein SAMN05428642_101800 [Flaviramulus basaltis]|uniref:Uncharacterized protein n=1 Tax=Flaviramulus basaltis TaxID=369401 RepID=A0A1K2ICQ7_9FLAO|nr:hypothetical protein SAMN05428642_101800 [Flaviramulus basaltis]